MRALQGEAGKRVTGRERQRQSEGGRTCHKSNLQKITNIFKGEIHWD